MADPNQFDILQTNGPSYFTGPVYLGGALDQTGQLTFFNASSAKNTIFQSGNATADVTYILPTAGPTGNNYVLASSTAGVLSWLNAIGTYAPIGSAFVTIGNDSTLTAERALTGTTNQVVVTDNGVNSTVVLSLPQSINTGATPTFAGMNAGSSKITSLANGTASSDASTFGQIKVLQWIGATTTTVTTTTSSTYQATSLSASITPSSASNRVLIKASGTVRTATGLSASCIATLFRGTTNIDSVGATGYGFGYIDTAVAAGVHGPWSAVFIDSPSTTSATTYTVYVRNDDNVTSVSFGNTGLTQSIVLGEIV